ncbi:MAG: hypothetical protein ACRDD2_08635 [Sarcina sp.]
MIEQNNKKESVKLDQVLKYLFNTSNKVLVNLLNGLFNENFNQDEVEISISNNEFIEESLDVLKGDMFYTATNKKGKKINYHIEFQTKNDSTMVIRTFEYGFRKARDEANSEDNIKTIYFPKQKVIFFEENKSIEDSLKLKIVFPDGSYHIYKADVMKYWEYSKEEIIEKKMYPLIPLQLFNLRKELKKLEKNNNKEAIKLLAEKAKKLARSLAESSSELLHSEEIYGEDFHKMLLGIQNLIEYLNRAYFKDDNIEEEVEDMTRTLYDPEVEKKGLEKGLEKGFKKGLKEVKKKQIEIAKNLLDLLDDETIALKTELDIDVVKKLRDENKEKA